MKYTLHCPAPGCEYSIKVEAQSDDEAVEKIVKEGKGHAVMAHIELPHMSDEEMKKMVSEGMKKE